MARRLEWCVVPMAGRGSRLRPHAGDRPKALVRVKGRTLLEWLLLRLPGTLDRIVLVVRSEAEIRRHPDLPLLPRTVHYVEQPRPLGVADAVCRARGLVTGPFAVVMADTFYEESLAPHLRRWEAGTSDGAVLVEPLGDRLNEPAGQVRVREGRVERIEKADTVKEARHRVCGLAVLPEAAFSACSRLEPGASGEVELEAMVQWLIDRGHDFDALPYGGWRRNVNDENDLRAVRERLAGDTAG